MKRNILKATAAILAAVLSLTSAGCGYEEGNYKSAGFDTYESYGVTSRSSVLSLSDDGTVSITRRSRENTEAMGEEGTWTVMVYLCGTDLESDGSYAVHDIKEMIKASTTENVRFVVETGGTQYWNGYNISSDNIGRYEICGGKIKLVDQTENANMGRPKTLADFLSWGVETYPAEKMGLIMWNHGGGSITGVCFDENNSFDSLSLPEIDIALSSVYDSMTDKFEFIGFDACLMATVETANILVPHAKYMIASEETEPGYGWDYTTIGKYLSKNPQCSGADIGKVIADSFYTSCKEIYQEDSCTMSVTDLSKIDSLIQAINTEAAKMNEAATDNAMLSEMARNITNAKNYGGNNRSEGYTNMIDLGSLFESALGSETVTAALKETVVHNLYGADQKGSTGLSTYYPLSISGSQELVMFKEICVSPYYMSFVDRLTYGSANSGDIEDYSGDDMWLSGDCWDYSDWYEESAEFEDYTGYWDFLDESDYCEMDFVDYDCSISYMEEPHLDDEGTYSFTLDEQSVYNTSGVYCSLFMYDDETGYALDLGCDNYVDVDWETGVVNDLFEGFWYTLSDGQFLNLNVVEEYETYDIYTTPVLLNGEETNLRIKMDYSGDELECFIVGAWDGVDECGQAAKGYTQLEEGDVINPIYYVYDDYGEYLGDIYGYDYIFENNGDIYMDYLEASDYLYSFRIDDIFGNQYYTDFVTFGVEENGDLYFYVEE